MAQTILANNPAYVLASPGIVPANAMDKAFSAADTVNGNAFLSSGNDMLCVFNSDTNPHSFTISSAPDEFGRFADVSYSVAAGLYSFVTINTASLYIQPNTNEVLIACASALVKFLVVTNV